MGLLYCHLLPAVIGKNFINRGWKLYQTVPTVKAAVFSDFMIVRHVIWMFNVPGILSIR